MYPLRAYKKMRFREEKLFQITFTVLALYVNNTKFNSDLLFEFEGRYLRNKRVRGILKEV